VEEMVPAVALQVTAELNAPVPATVAAQLEVPLMGMLVGVQVTATEVTVAGVVTATVAEDDFAVFWTEVAVMVAEPEVGAVAGAVNTPVAEIVPAVVVHVTAEL
jgi:hypothetical protein